MAFPRDSSRGAAPLIGLIADSGQLARLGIEAGIDVLLVLSAGVYRNLGVPAIGCYLPHGNSNDLTERHLREQVLPRAGTTPVLAGLFPNDPTTPTPERLARLRDWGVHGVVNYPNVTLLDGSLRAIFEEEGNTVQAEIDLLQEARSAGLAAVGFVGPDPDAARRFAGCGLDAIILTVGLTRDVPDIHERRDRVQHAIREFDQLLEAVRAVDARVPCLLFGGPITTPEDFEQVVRQLPFDGFVGGSVFGRLPVETAVPATIRRFRGVALRRHEEAAPQQTGFGPLLGATPIMRQLFRLIERAAAFDLNVCIEGESGVGKELVATQVHRLSRRAHGPLVTLNCGAIPDSLLESELFGHERGAFTGANRRRLGKFELAHQGTLFLDEVGDLSPHGQVALLRAIQQREIVRVGGDAPLAIDVRILSASNQPLARLVEQGRFRADLYYRLNNLTLAVPPLRERPDDIPLLAEAVLAGLRVQMNRELAGLSGAFLDNLRRHAWPGNVRELQHVLAQAALLEDGPVLEGRHFTPTTGVVVPRGDVARQVEQEMQSERLRKVRDALREAGGNKSKAAALLGVTRKTLYAWLRELTGG